MKKQLHQLLVIFMTIVMVISSLTFGNIVKAVETEELNQITQANSYISIQMTNSKGEEIKEGYIIGRDEQLNVSLSFTFKDDVNNKPIVGKNEWVYRLPDGIHINGDHDKHNLLDQERKLVGTYQIAENGKDITFVYSDEWLSTHGSQITTSLNFKVQLDTGKIYENGSLDLDFGDAETNITVALPGGKVTGIKNVSSSLDENEYLTYTIDLKVDGNVDDFSLTDTLGDDLEFIAGSFILKEKDTETGENINENVILANQIANIDLGSLNEGNYQLIYKVKVKDDAKINKDGKFSNVNNIAHWEYDGTKEGNAELKDPNVLQTKMISKSGKIDKKTGLITWEVILNSGNYKVDMSNYTFKDILTSNNQEYVGSYTIYQYVEKTDDEQAKWELVAGCQIPFGSDKFEYLFGEDAGHHEYKIVYQTIMKGDPIWDQYSNKATIDDGKNHFDKEEILTDNNEGQVVGVELTKENDSENRKIITENGEEYGIVDWKVQLNLNEFKVNYKPELNKLQFIDELNNKDHIEYIVNSIQVYLDDTELDESMYKSETNNGSLSITFKKEFFKDSNYLNYRNLIIKYQTKDDNTDRTISNKAKFIYKTGHNNDQSTEEKSDSYDIVTDHKDSVVKEATPSNKEIKWYVYGNCAKDNNDLIKDQPLYDFKGQSVTVIDTLPEGLIYREGSAYYTLSGVNDSIKIEPVISQNQEGKTVLTFVVPEVHKNVIKVEYITDIDEDILIDAGNNGEFDGNHTVTFENHVTLESGEIDLGSGTKTVTVDNQILSKKSIKPNKENPFTVSYKIDVNQNAFQLNKGEDLVLYDIFDYRTVMKLGTYKVVDKDGKDISDQCSLKYETIQLEDGTETTQLTITVPDETALTIMYDVDLIAKPGDTLSGITNKVSLHGTGIEYGSQDSNEFEVVQSNANASGIIDKISIKKIDAYDINALLGGAEFTLYRWDKNGNEDENFIKVDTKETDINGLLTFDKDTSSGKASGLLLNELYYFVETKVPDKVNGEDTPTDLPYLLDEAKHYFVLKNNNENEYEKLKKDVEEKLGSDISNAIHIGSEYIVSNENDGEPTSIDFNAKKVISLAGIFNKPQENQKFNFTLECIKSPEGIEIPTQSTVNSDENISFTVPLKRKGSYQFIMKESTNQELLGYKLDDVNYIIDVDVNKVNGKNILEVVSVKYKRITNANVLDIEKEQLEFVNISTQVQIEKVTPSGQRVIGAKLQIIDLDDQVIDSWVSTDEAHYLTGVLKPNETYILHEVKAPKGYIQADDIEFTVDGNGKLTTVVMEDQETHVDIVKKTPSGENLAGATLQILDQNNEVVEQWVSDEETHEIIAQLEAGATYTLHEVKAPKGYILADNIEFTVDNNGELTTVVMEDQETHVNIVKKTPSGENLIGATLQILDQNNEVVEQWVSDEETHEIIAQLEAGATYTLHEVKAPKGYILAEDIDFDVPTDAESVYIEMIDKEEKIVKSDDSTMIIAPMVAMFISLLSILLLKRKKS